MCEADGGTQLNVKGNVAKVHCPADDALKEGDHDEATRS
jgi:hypothetical protein